MWGVYACWSRGALAEAADVGAGEQTSAWRELCVVVDGAHDGLDRVDGDVWLLVLDEVVAAQRDDMGVIGRESCQFGLHGAPESLREAVESRRGARELVALVGGGDDDRRRVTE